MGKVLKFAVVNGPLLGQIVHTDGRMVHYLPDDGDPVAYVELDSCLYTDDGLPLMAVEGSSWSFVDAKEAKAVIVAHPLHIPSLCDLTSNVVSPVTLTVEHH